MREPELWSTRRQVGNQQLHRLLAAEFVDVQFVGQLDPTHGRVGPHLAVDTKGDAVELQAAAFALEHHLEVALADDTLLHQLEGAVEQRLGKVPVSYTHLTLPTIYSV